MAVGGALLIAVGVSAMLCLVLGQFAAPSLTGPTEIVGYPTFANYNFERSFWIYRLTVYAFPLFAIVGYVLLARFGPLRSRGPRPVLRTPKRGVGRAYIDAFPYIRGGYVVVGHADCT
jgi:hypothetical protein